MITPLLKCVHLAIAYRLLLYQQQKYINHEKLSLLFSIFGLCILINSEALAYCASYSNNYYAAYIGEIGIRNKSSQNGPSYYTFDTSVMQVIKGSCNVSYIGLRSITGQYDSLYTRIWADWNHNDVFEASELVYQSREKHQKQEVIIFMISSYHLGRYWVKQQ